MKKSGFTMIELVFVIVIIGVLSAIALPRLSVSRDDALISRASDTIQSVRLAIVNYKNRMLVQGKTGSGLYYADLGSNFDNVIKGSLPGKDSWSNPSKNVYKYKISDSRSLTFTYKPADGSITCSGDATVCSTYF